MKVTEVKIGQVWKNYKNKKEKTVASLTEDEAMMDDMSYIPIKTLLAGKSWKCISDDAVAHEKESKSAEEVAGDGTSYSEVMEEIVADERSLVDHYTKKPKKEKKASKKAPVEKAEKNEHKKREVNGNVNAILEYIFKCVEELGGECGVPRDADMKFRALRKNGKQFCKLMWSGKSAKLFSKVKLDQYNTYAINYPLSNVYSITECDETMIRDILTVSFNECAGKKTKTKKEEK